MKCSKVDQSESSSRAVAAVVLGLSGFSIVNLELVF